MKRVWWGVGGAGFVIAGVLALTVFEVQTAFIDERVDEALSDGGTVLLAGAFHDVEQKGTGTVEIVATSPKVRELRLRGLNVDNGPDLRVFLVALKDAQDSESIKAAETLDLGELRGNIGTMRYTVPETFQEGKHLTVVIWCERFGVNFATAPLRPPPAGS